VVDIAKWSLEEEQGKKQEADDGMGVLELALLYV
jgi:hypothetical protein